MPLKTIDQSSPDAIKKIIADSPLGNEIANIEHLRESDFSN